MQQYLSAKDVAELLGVSKPLVLVITNERWTDGDGEKQERTEWHRIVAWGKTAEIAAEHVKKGTHLLVEGAIQTREWEDSEGDKRVTGEIRAQRIVLLSRKADDTDTSF